MAARFFKIEIAQALQRFDHAHIFIHHDNGTRTEHRAGFGDGIVIHVQRHHDVGRQHRRRGAARNHRFEFFAVFHAAGHFQKLGKRRAQRHFIIARALDMAGNRKQLGAAGIFNALPGKGFAAVANDKGHRSKGFGVVDGGGFAVKAERGGKRRLETRLAFFALQRFQQRGFFAADICAIAMRTKQIKAEIAAHDVVAEKTGGARLGQSQLEALVAFKNLAVDIIVARFCAHGVAGNNHAFNQRVRIEIHNVAVFKRARFALVGVAHHIFGTGERARHKAPFQAGGKARTAPAAQTGCFHFGDHIVLRQFFAQDFAQSLITAARLIGVEMPAVGIVGIYLVKNDT